jgi:hypothetical protein
VTSSVAASFGPNAYEMQQMQVDHLLGLGYGGAGKDGSAPPSTSARWRGRRERRLSRQGSAGVNGGRSRR